MGCRGGCSRTVGRGGRRHLLRRELALRAAGLGLALCASAGRSGQRPVAYALRSNTRSCLRGRRDAAHRPREGARRPAHAGATTLRPIDAPRDRYHRPASLVPPLSFRRGLDLKQAVAGLLAESYHSTLIDQIKADDFTYRAGRLTIHLAKEFGFCYGVDRAVDYAYQTRKRFPDRPVYLTGEIIHNPHVNDELRAMGIRFMSDDASTLDRRGPDDVVILPPERRSVA